MGEALNIDRREAPPGRNRAGPIRVLIVDDSLTARTVLSRLIDAEADMEVVAKATTAEMALARLREHVVDVILLDLEMPGMGGLEALPQILKAANGGQVLVVSSLTEDGAEATLAALSMGAADTMLKPRPGQFDDAYRARLTAHVRALGRTMRPGDAAPDAAPVQKSPASPRRASPKDPKVLAIGASTGGIHALCLLLRALPRQLDIPVLVTQHLPGSFMSVLARQLELAASREAVVAQEGTVIAPGRIYVAPGEGHMLLHRSGARTSVRIAAFPTSSGCTPAVDPMLESLAQAVDGQALAVILSGMGRDGAEGAARLVERGGTVFAQDRATSAVWGMPRGVVDAGLASAVLPPEALAEEIVGATGAAAWK